MSEANTEPSPFKPAAKPTAKSVAKSVVNSPSINPDKPATKPAKPTRIQSPTRSERLREKGACTGKTSNAEIELRTHKLAEKLSSGQKKWQLKEWAMTEWGIAARTFEDYYTRAYKFLLSAADTSPQEEFLKSCAYYDAVMADESVTPETRLQARINKDKLTGIQRPRKLAMTDADGEIVTPASSGDVANLTSAVNRLTVASMANLSDDDLKKLIAARQVLYAVAKPASPANPSKAADTIEPTGPPAVAE